MPEAPARTGSLTPEAFASLGSMEGIYEPIVEISYVGPLTHEAFASFGSMEGMVQPTIQPVEVQEPTAKAAAPATPHWPGYVMAAVTALAAYLLCDLPFAPFTIQGAESVRHPISAAILAILIGVFLRNTLPLPRNINFGCRKIVKKIIPIAIVLTGAGLNLANIAGVGASALVIIVLCIGVSVSASYFIGKALGLSTKTAILIGAGTGICGNSAVVAVAPLIDADDEDLVLSVGTINLLGMIVMLLCPLIGGMLQLGDEAFGLWAGTSIHAVPQVVAAGFAYSPEAGTFSTLVKLVRVTMLAPFVAVLAMVYARRHSADIAKGRNVVVHYARFVPWFVWGFVLLATLNTLGLIPSLHFELSESIAGTPRMVDISTSLELKRFAKILLTLAMAAIGLELNVRVLLSVGGRAFLTGTLACIALASISLGLITIMI